MKKQRRPFIIIALLASFGLLGGSIGDSIINNTKEADASANYLYNTNFQDLDVSGTTEAKYINQVTGYVHANDYLNTKTVTYQGTRWLDYCVPSSSTGFHTIGWIGGGGGLTKLRNGETYTAEIVMDILNLEFIYVEYKSNVYGAFTVTPDGAIGDNAGPDMVDVSYNTSTNLLKFSFTAFQFDAEHCPGYIQLVARNALTTAKCYVKSIKIYHAEHVMDGSFEEYALSSNFDVNDANVFSKNYINTPTTMKASVEGGSDHKLVFSSINNLNTGAFFFNRLNIMQIGREYTLTLKYEQTNCLFMYVDYGGTWETNRTWSKIDFVWGGVSNNIDGADCNWNVAIDTINQIITIRFRCTNAIANPYQLEFGIEDNNSNSGSNGYSFSMSYAHLDVQSYPVGIEVDTSGFDPNVEIGGVFEWNNLVVELVASDEKTTTLAYGTDYNVSGVDTSIVGTQSATITYGDYSKIIEVHVTGDVTGLIVYTNNVNTTLHFGEELDLSGLIVKVTLAGDRESIVLPGVLLGGYAISYNTFDNHKAGNHTITVIYQDFTTDFTVTVEEETSVSFAGVTYVPTGTN